MKEPLEFKYQAYGCIITLLLFVGVFFWISSFFNSPPDYSKRDGFVIESNEGVTVLTILKDSEFSENAVLRSTAIDAVNYMEDNPSALYNGIVIDKKVNFLDAYGNATPRQAVSVYFSQETIKKINFDNWPNNSAVDFYLAADAYWISPAFSDIAEVPLSKGAPSEQPKAYRELFK